IEKQPAFLWHGGMLLDNTRMQISFMKDLATMRDPTSPFTFLNYLHTNNRLLQFLNLGSFYPFRVEFNDYLQWCGKHFDKFCHYGETVVGLEPVELEDGTVEKIKVTSVNDATKETSVRVAKKVIVAIGGQPMYPSFAKELVNHPRVAHSSQYIYRHPVMLPDMEASYRLAVIGSGQSAAEVFYDLAQKYPNAQVNLIFRDSALRPSDDSSFVNEIFDPDARDGFFRRTPEERQQTLARNKATNYSVVNISLIEELYNMMYKQKLPGNEGKPKHLLRPGNKVLEMTATGDKVTIKFEKQYDVACCGELVEPVCNNRLMQYEESFDAVIVATGYQRQTHLDLLQNLDTCIAKDATTSQPIVDREYRIVTKPHVKAKIYLQGCCEQTHGLSDTLLSVLAVRGAEVADSLA
ncbi:L-lysine 6-monooxygenase, partial [Gaertneriomyces semiglobifer]